MVVARPELPRVLAQVALDQMPADTKNDPIFNVPAKYTDNYQYILNPNPKVVNDRTKIYQQFKAA